VVARALTAAAAGPTPGRRATPATARHGTSQLAGRRPDEVSSAATSTAADTSGNARPGRYSGKTNGPSLQWDFSFFTETLDEVAFYSAQLSTQQLQ
jgi:hypothetical protein